MQKIRVVIPCYNEEKRLPVQAFISYCASHPQHHFYFVNDGSTDRTEDVLMALTLKLTAQATVVSLPKNRGKAEAVRQGLLRAARDDSYHILGYFDADLSTPLEEITSMIRVMEQKKTYELIFGSRVGVFGHQIERGAARHYMGRIFSTCASLLLGLPIYDTQCGAKLIRPKAVTQFLQEPFISRWLFDIELFFRFLQRYNKTELSNIMAEVPLRHWVEKGESKISPAYIFKVPWELLKIYLHYN